MVWSRAQQTLFFRAAAAAGWNDAQRYIAMAHAGCRVRGRGKARDSRTGFIYTDRRASAADPNNDNDAFERVMALAEASAAGRGASSLMPARRSGRPWADTDRRQRERMARKARDIWEELSLRVPEVFMRDGLDGLVRRVCMHDDASLTMRRAPESLDECDSGQLHRVIEAAKGWGGRECLRRGISPTTFRVPPSCARQLHREHELALERAIDTATAAHREAVTGAA